jgi:hypothetical protein
LVTTGENSRPVLPNADPAIGPQATRIDAVCWKVFVLEGFCETVVFSCFNQDQEMDGIDFPALHRRLSQNSVPEKLTRHPSPPGTGGGRGQRFSLGVLDARFSRL